ncbi:hypothetical protein BCL90_4602 [Pedobacter alluvionis]|uniref:Uncharacterized protein n=1 Tax=Pedobacter alluvionis TaxID=475253 RepID=A0A497XUF1_9SPHI|nr:hypothetical protein BCL90_4602 [Pedobacter alluvionis]
MPSEIGRHFFMGFLVKSSLPKVCFQKQSIWNNRYNQIIISTVSSLREGFFSRQPAPIFGEVILQRSLPACALRLFIFPVAFKGIHELNRSVIFVPRNDDFYIGGLVNGTG